MVVASVYHTSVPPVFECRSVCVCVTSVTCEVRVCGYVKNKAGLTGQTFPGRRILGHWPYPAPEELAETEPGTQD